MLLLLLKFSTYKILFLLYRDRYRADNFLNDNISIFRAALGGTLSCITNNSMGKYWDG